jgi:hypothetical protein
MKKRVRKKLKAGEFAQDLRQRPLDLAGFLDSYPRLTQREADVFFGALDATRAESEDRSLTSVAHG